MSITFFVDMLAAEGLYCTKDYTVCLYKCISEILSGESCFIETALYAALEKISLSIGACGEVLSDSLPYVVCLILRIRLITFVSSVTWITDSNTMVAL